LARASAEVQLVAETHVDSLRFEASGGQEEPFGRLGYGPVQRLRIALTVAWSKVQFPVKVAPLPDK
jgi:hypothetical protein